MSSRLQGKLQMAIQNVSEALTLDGQGRNQEAYVQYLKCTANISQVLLEDVQTFRDEDVQARQKLISLSQRCVDRLAELVQSVHGMATGNIQCHDAITSNSMLGRLVSTVTPTTLTNQSQRPTAMTPMEIAYKQNQQIMAAYKARVAKMNAGKDISTAMNLSLQRRLAENVALAKARQEALEKKMRDRQLRLQEQADRRFASHTGISREEQERKKIYTKILEYEQDTKWPVQWREKLKLHPKDEEIINTLVNKILNTSDHPLSHIMRKYQYDIYNKLRPLVEKYHVPDTKIPYENCTVCSDGSRRSSRVDLDPKKASHSTASLQSLISNSSDKYDEGGDFERSFEESKHNLETAMEKGENLKRKLSQSTDASKAILAGGVDKLGSFNVEDMDYLFDSDDDDVEDDLFTDTGPDDSMTNLVDEALVRHLGSITKDVHIYLEKMYSMFVVAYEQLDSVTAKDQCFASLEGPFFNPIWPYLLLLFRLTNKRREILLACVMTRKKSDSQSDIGVNQKYCLNSEDNPYNDVVAVLSRLPNMVSPLNKLECIVQTSKLICQCIEENSEASSSGIGADDLLPILSYVVIQSGLPQLVSECQAMEEFIHEGYLMGEEGYCLTTLQTALTYIESLHEQR